MKNMSKLMISGEDMAKAVKKLKGFVGETVTLSFGLRGPEKIRIATMAASNGIAQATIKFPYEGDNEENVEYYLDSSFVECVDTLSSLGEKFEITETDGVVKIACGRAVVPAIKVDKEKVVEIKAAKITEIVSVSCIVNAKAFASFVERGGYSYAEKSVHAMMNGNVDIFPIIKGENPQLLAISTDGSRIASAHMDVECRDMAKFAAFIKEKRGVAVKFTSLAPVVKRLTSEKIHLIFTEKQFLVIEGSDTYLFSTVADMFGEGVLKLADSSCFTKAGSCTVDAEALKKGFAVAGLLGREGNKAFGIKVALEGDVLTLSNSKGSRAEVQVTSLMDGKAEAVFNYDMLKMSIDMCPQSITLSLSADKGGKIILEGAGSMSLMAGLKQ